MCAINGFTWNDVALIEKMNKVTRHRGPDDNGVYTDSNISLGHNRLSIIDLTKTGAQPMIGKNGNVIIVYNGEFYNFKDIKSRLPDHVRFNSTSDTEVILRMYENSINKTNVQKYVRGMFAYAIYDRDRNRTILVRDRFGIKPLYYYYDKKKLIFSSEIKGILVHDIPRLPNKKIINDFISFGLLDHCEDTFFEGIKVVPPGHMMMFDHATGILRKAQWYDLSSKLVEKNVPFETVVRELRTKFEDTIVSHLVSDVPVGSCLSGGIDSTSAVSVMSRYHNNIKTFSLTFDGYDFDETKWIDIAISEIPKIQSYRVTPTVKELEKDISDLIVTQEEPFGSLSVYGQYNVMRLAHQNNMKVLLDGQGSDEQFAGYMRYFIYKMVDDIYAFRFREAYSAFRKTQKTDRKIILAELISYLPFMRNRVLDIINRKYNRIEISGVPMLSQYRPTLQWILMRDLLKASIPSLLRYEDKNSMRWGVESRVPYLDHEFVEYVMSIPPRYKMKGCATKYVFRSSMKGILPEQILRRSDKIGFQAPDEIWLMEPFLSHAMIDANFNEDLFKRGQWDISYARKLFGEHLAGTSDYSRQIWKYINVDKWYNSFIVEDNVFDKCLSGL